MLDLIFHPSIYLSIYLIINILTEKHTYTQTRTFAEVFIS